MIVYKASFTKRLVARILDFFIALFIPVLMSLIFFEINFQKNDWYPQPWNWNFVFSGILAIIGILFVMIIYPILNEKNLGQTFGKKILKINLLDFSEDKNIRKKIVLREIPIAFFYIIPIILQLISGIETKHLLIIYLRQNPEYKKGLLFFLFKTLPNGIEGVKNISLWQSIINFISIIFSKIQIFIFIFITISIFSSEKNISINDKYLELAVVDYSTLIPKKEGPNE